MTVELNSEPDRDGVGRRFTLIGTGGHDPGTTSADLEALCLSVAELARTTSKPPSRIRLEHRGTTVEVEWAKPVRARPTAPSATPPTEEAAAPGAEGPHYVCAPMIGTFYHSPEPGSPPFVTVGATVRPGQPIGVLEVMKMMSPIEADIAGTVVEILVPDAGPVEFQQRLVAIAPADG